MVGIYGVHLIKVIKFFTHNDGMREVSKYIKGKASLFEVELINICLDDSVGFTIFSLSETGLSCAAIKLTGKGR